MANVNPDSVIEVWGNIITVAQFASKHSEGNIDRAIGVIEVLIRKGDAKIVEDITKQVSQISTGADELKKYITTPIDKVMYTFLFSHLGEQSMGNMIADMINQSIKICSRNNQDILSSQYTIKSINEDSFGGVGIAMAITLLLTSDNNKTNDVKMAMKTLTLATASYLRREIAKSEFLRYVWKVQEDLGLSDKFYDGLVDYYGSHTRQITSLIRVS